MHRLALVVVIVACACSDDGGGPPPVFPANYRDTYQEVRNCRFSIEHDLVRIRVLAAPEALAAYMNRTAFPTGAIVLKEEYDEGDTTCSGSVVTYTVMQKLDVGSATGDLDWRWEEADGDRKLREVNIRSCVTCHTECGKPPDGHDGTCTVP